MLIDVFICDNNSSLLNFVLGVCLVYILSKLNAGVLCKKCLDIAQTFHVVTICSEEMLHGSNVLGLIGVAFHLEVVSFVFSSTTK
jgi:hypothetical protein